VWSVPRTGVWSVWMASGTLPFAPAELAELY
jgi:hypothetical protein